MAEQDFYTELSILLRNTTCLINTKNCVNSITIFSGSNNLFHDFDATFQSFFISLLSAYKCIMALVEGRDASPIRQKKFLIKFQKLFSLFSVQLRA